MRLFRRSLLISDGVDFTTLDPASIVNVSTAALALSGGNLTATNGGANNDCQVRALTSKSAGKFYFEVAIGAGAGSADNECGLIQTNVAGGTFNSLGSGAAGEVNLSARSRILFVNGTTTTLGGAGTLQGAVVGIAVDLDNKKVWFRHSLTGGANWNNSGPDNPATNTGGASIAAMTFPLIPRVRLWGGGGVETINFGATPFSMTPPAGFIPGWPK